jgi:hypothetical protein
MKYLIEDFSKDKNRPEYKVVCEDDLFELLQGKPDNISVYRLPETCIIDWS